MTASTPEPARMSGPDHYREAERLLALANEVTYVESEDSRVLAAQAQVHATLALVAVTAELASHTAPPAMRSVSGGDGPWKALLNPTEETS